MNKNTWLTKLKRTVTAFWPVAKNRQGECHNCGKCCYLPTRCPFLQDSADGKSYCTVYNMRSLNCRKYPRTEKECLTKATCGYSFE
ncbi:MAG: hypothetical protein WC467_02195 [Patescibacteria group bacterium]